MNVRSLCLSLCLSLSSDLYRSSLLSPISLLLSLHNSLCLTLSSVRLLSFFCHVSPFSSTTMRMFTRSVGSLSLCVRKALTLLSLSVFFGHVSVRTAVCPLRYDGFDSSGGLLHTAVAFARKDATFIGRVSIETVLASSLWYKTDARTTMDEQRSVDCCPTGACCSCGVVVEKALSFAQKFAICTESRGKCKTSCGTMGISVFF